MNNIPPIQRALLARDHYQKLCRLERDLKCEFDACYACELDACGLEKDTTPMPQRETVYNEIERLKDNALHLRYNPRWENYHNGTKRKLDQRKLNEQKMEIRKKLGSRSAQLKVSFVSAGDAVTVAFGVRQNCYFGKLNRWDVTLCMCAAPVVHMSILRQMCVWADVSDRLMNLLVKVVDSGNPRRVTKFTRPRIGVMGRNAAMVTNTIHETFMLATKACRKNKDASLISSFVTTTGTTQNRPRAIEIWTCTMANRNAFWSLEACRPVA
ncbi:hypothetical protein B0H63DRAFT_511641 [Podospora didyma]|uniref:Uncharacterized protein n=1 Tax=Podospora didyma TaxID=330526 RepID=A0AAE0TWD4_9PEZI|nr:hypothetical protein B0H63DRAFT_511641 [Podospora didyma]